MRRKAPRVVVAAGAVLVTVLTMTTVASAAPITPTTPRQGSLTQVGPLAEHGFPAWYRDSNNVRLEACTTLTDPLCVPADVPDPTKPVSFPTNFPDEFFYQLAGANVPLIGGATAKVSLNLEGAFANGAVNEGDQMVFGRVRIRFDAPTGEKYRITHPYGVDEIVADDGKVNATEDIGTVAGAFGGALGSRIGPFLKWDPAVAPAAPAGHTGNPGIDHRIVGSPYATNFVKIEHIDGDGMVLDTLGSTDLFSVQGRYATNAGVNLDDATYTSSGYYEYYGYGQNLIEVYATSEPGQAIQITGNSALGFRTTRLRGQDGHYYARVPVTGPVTAGDVVEVVNTSDSPPSHKTLALKDYIFIPQSPQYDADDHTLSVAGISSDYDENPGVLTVKGYGPLENNFSGVFTNVLAAPATVTINSSMGGSATVPVYSTGGGMLPDPPTAVAPTPVNNFVGQTITLDGTGSLGAIDSYSWTQTSGPIVMLSNPTTATSTFVAPSLGTYTFDLVATGPGGSSVPLTVTLEVTPIVNVVADAGPDQTVARGRTVTLDATRTTGANAFSWRQTAGPTVTLTGGTTATPTFTLPAVTLPAPPGPNATYVANRAPLTFEVTGTGPGSSGTDTVTITPQAETLSGLTVRYRTRGEWRISGTSNLVAGQRVAVVLGPDLRGRIIATATVDATGAFSIRQATPNPVAIRTVSFISSAGGQALAVPIVVSN